MSHHLWLNSRVKGPHSADHTNWIPLEESRDHRDHPGEEHLVGLPGDIADVRSWEETRGAAQAVRGRQRLPGEDIKGGAGDPAFFEGRHQGILINYVSVLRRFIQFTTALTILKRLV